MFTRFGRILQLRTGIMDIASDVNNCQNSSCMRARGRACARVCVRVCVCVNPAILCYAITVYLPSPLVGHGSPHL